MEPAIVFLNNLASLHNIVLDNTKDSLSALKAAQSLCTYLKYGDGKSFYNTILLNPKYNKYIKVVDHYAQEPPGVMQNLQAAIKPDDLQVTYPGCANNNAIFKGIVKPYQERAVRDLQKRRGLLLIYGTGSGKTLCAILASQCFLSNNKNGRVIFLAPNTSIKENFTKAMKGYGVSDSDIQEKYIIETYKSAAKVLAKLDSKKHKYFLILDEVHYINNYHSQGFYNVFQLSKQSQKVLLLSATPIVNNVLDIIPLMALIDPAVAQKFFTVGIEKGNEVMVLKSDFESAYEALKKDSDLSKVLSQMKAWLLPFRCNISIYRTSADDLKYYPTAKIIDNFFVMTRHQLDIYEVEEGKDKKEKGAGDNDTFRVNTRQVSNDLGDQDYSPKMIYIFDLLKQKNKKIVIYSAYQDSGIKYLEDRIVSDLIPKKDGTFKNLKYGKITGDTKDLDREKAKNDFNAGSINLLLITKAGSEGIDLKCTTDVIIMDPYFNDSVTLQVMGRGIRYKSHVGNDCPNKEVTIHNLYLIKASDVECLAKIDKCDRYQTPQISTDLFLKITSIEKQRIIDGFINSLGSQDSIETNKCDLGSALKISDRVKYPTVTKIWMQSSSKNGGPPDLELFAES